MSYRSQEQGVTVIAQADSGGYDPSGYICYEFEGSYYISPFSHCSCYTTWECIGPGDGDKYTKEELINMAKNQLDPAWKERNIMKEDYDYAYLVEVYGQVLEYFNGE